MGAKNVSMSAENVSMSAIDEISVVSIKYGTILRDHMIARVCLDSSHVMIYASTLTNVTLKINILRMPHATIPLIITNAVGIVVLFGIDSSVMTLINALTLFMMKMLNY